MNEIERITAQILKDRETRKIAPQSNAIDCFACGRSFLYRRPNGDDSGRFCSANCRNAYDAGFPAYAAPSQPNPSSIWRVVAGTPDLKIGAVYNSLADSRQLSRGIKRMGRHGWIIDCFGCGKEFDSKGLRCCSLECEQSLKKHAEAAELMAEVGMDAPVKRKCEAPGCGKAIPKWRNGRAVSKAAKYCSEACGRRARNAAR